MLQADPRLGWKFRPGSYSQTLNSGNKVTLKIDPDGSRSNGTPASGPSIYFVGGSFTSGSIYIEDTQTLPAQLEVLFTGYQVKNFGVPAYGSYQSYLNLEQRLQAEQSPALVIYGFVDFHDMRNAGMWFWHRGLQVLNSEPLGLPYLSLDESNQLIEIPAAPYPAPALVHSSALVATLVDGFEMIRRRHAAQHSREITQKIIQKIFINLKSRNIPFVVAYLSALNEKAYLYTQELTELGVPVANCTGGAAQVEGPFTAEDIHPSAALNHWWAECIRNFLQSRKLL